MKKRFILVGILIMLAVFAAVFSACGNGQNQIRFLTPDGGTLLPVAQLFTSETQIDGIPFSGEIVSLDTVESRLFNGGCEAAVAPVNLCAKVYGANQSYLFAGVVVWGNNFIVSTNGETPESLSALKGEVLYAWGRNAVPGKTLTAILQKHEIETEVVTDPAKFSDPDKIGLYFLSDAPAIRAEIDKPGSTVEWAMLPEPVVTATVDVAKKAVIAFDLSELYDIGGNVENYPQAGLLIKKDFAQKNPAIVGALLNKIAESAEYCLKNPAEAANLAKDTLQSVALPAAPVLTKYIGGRGQNIMSFTRVDDALIETVNEYLKAIGEEPPADGFYLR